MMKKPNKKTILIVSVLVILCLGIWTLWGNTALEVNEYEIMSDKIPEAFTGFRIAQVSDLHISSILMKIMKTLVCPHPKMTVTPMLLNTNHGSMPVATTSCHPLAAFSAHLAMLLVD